jgi:hypothetical protein
LGIGDTLDYFVKCFRYEILEVHDYLSEWRHPRELGNICINAKNVVTSQINKTPIANILTFGTTFIIYSADRAIPAHMSIPLV